jgi:alkylhydroperoxidase family enzyme
VADRIAGLVAMSSGDLRLDSVMRLTCGRALSLQPLPVEDDLVDGPAERDAVVAAFAEQFATDVTGVGANQRKQFLSTLGDSAFRTVVMIFVADFVPRVRAGVQALGLGQLGNGSAVQWDHDSDPVDALLNGFVPAVARLDALDPLTTEIVRLRGAAQHNCRLCRSRRYVDALDAGGSETLYAEIERHEISKLFSESQKAAMQYVDALIWSPSQIGQEVATAVRRHYSEDEALELTFDVMRNACNKIMVSLGADAAQVESGTELCRIDADGQTVVC